MPTIQNQPLNRRFNFTDDRLIDMLEGALCPPRRQRPPQAEHDFLVMNLHEDLSPVAVAPDTQSE